ncbi:F-box/kelch-repeat protein At3g23880-like [Argentina anserina]|uniref:F-box/kelch-repeat protein At3g23880-like n=1 Tax=Argentina anserina TaxID=57926 RepID=UPI0021765C47|nr:F-box/kelch-repeat protein At3g23880-like [Potentilla anserina]
MAEGKHVPEDIVVDILSRLPVKSLIRFRRVSKRWRSIVSDPQFAKLQFQNTTQGRRRLVYLLDDSNIETLDLEPPSRWWASIRKLTCPFEHEDQKRHRVMVVGSCNGLVCLSTRICSLASMTSIYIWNPSTGFSLKLPDPGFPDYINRMSMYCGFGYLPATGDYKALVAAYNDDQWGTLQVRVFSTRAGIWKQIESPFRPSSYPVRKYITDDAATVLGVTFHWIIDYFSQRSVIHAFDLVKEEFREMNGFHLLQTLDCFGGCLYGFCKGLYDSSLCIELWVMREYWVSDSWTKLYRIVLSDQVDPGMLVYPYLATETSTVVAQITPEHKKMEIVRIEHEEDDPLVTDRLRRRYHMPSMIVYEESLLRIPDNHAVMKEYKVKKPTDAPANKQKSKEIICLALFNYFLLNILISSFSL